MAFPLHFPYNVLEKVNELSAAQLLGAVWNWCLYGALVVQFYVYSHNFPRENIYVELFAYTILFLETLQTALSGADLYYWFAAGFGNVDQFTTSFTSFVDVPIMGSVVALSVQFFFVYRIFTLGEKRPWLLCAAICLLSIVSASGAFAVRVFKFSYIKDVFMDRLSLEVSEMTWIVGMTLSDLLIASVMFCHLRKIWTRDGDLNRHVLASIVRLAVETTAVFSIAGLLMVYLYPKTNWYVVCLTYILGKLHSNALLVSLNNRIAICDSDDVCGRFVDSQVVMYFRSSALSKATKATTPDEMSQKQKDLMRQLPEVKVDPSKNAADIA